MNNTHWRRESRSGVMLVSGRGRCGNAGHFDSALVCRLQMVRAPGAARDVDTVDEALIGNSFVCCRAR